VGGSRLKRTSRIPRSGLPSLAKPFAQYRHGGEQEAGVGDGMEPWRKIERLAPALLWQRVRRSSWLDAVKGLVGCARQVSAAANLDGVAHETSPGAHGCGWRSTEAVDEFIGAKGSKGGKIRRMGMAGGRKGTDIRRQTMGGGRENGGPGIAFFGSINASRIQVHLACDIAGDSIS